MLELEKSRFTQKIEKFKKCEKELKIKINEMEEVFNILTELKTDYDCEKRTKVQQFLKQNKGSAINNIVDFKLN